MTTRPSECTHLLCPHLVRTEKFLCALARAPFILSAKWGTASAAAKMLLRSFFNLSSSKSSNCLIQRKRNSSSRTQQVKRSLMSTLLRLYDAPKLTKANFWRARCSTSRPELMWTKSSLRMWSMLAGGISPPNRRPCASLGRPQRIDMSSRARKTYLYGGQSPLRVSRFTARNYCWQA